MGNNLVKTWEEACKVKGIDPNQLPDVAWMPEHMRAYMIAAYKLPIICEVLNEGHTFDYTTYNERKWSAWWNLDDAGAPLGFSFDGCAYGYADTYVGARLHLRSRELVLHLKDNFFELCRDYFAPAEIK